MIRSTLTRQYSCATIRRTSSQRSVFLVRTNKPLRLTRRSFYHLYAKKRSTDEKTAEPLQETATEDLSIKDIVEDPVPVPVASPPTRQYYEVYPTAPPAFPVQPPQYTTESTSPLPPWVWIMVGMLLATVFTRIMNFVSHPKEAMTEMMMKQMMSQMSNAQGPSPFGGSIPPTTPFGMGTGTPPTYPAYDTTAQASAATQTSPKIPTPPPPPPSQPPPPISPFNPPGMKEADPQKNGVEKPSAVTPSAAAAAASPDVPPSSVGPSFFQDVAIDPKAEPTEMENPDEAVDYMFDMLKDPEMRESLVQFLPENMRTPEMLESLMSSPMVKEQFKSMMTPQLLQQIKGFKTQAGQGDMKKQLQMMNISPDVLMKKLMNEPEVVAMMQKPNVMQAVVDLQKNPANMSKYMNDPEVMQFMMKMNELTLQAQQQSVEEGTMPVSPPSTSDSQLEPTPASTPSPSDSSSSSN